MEQGEIAHFEQFYLLPRCFPEFFFLKCVYMEEGLKLTSAHAFKLSFSEMLSFGKNLYNPLFHPNVSQLSPYKDNRSFIRCTHLSCGFSDSVCMSVCNAVIPFQFIEF